MFAQQDKLDGGSGGWQTFLGGVISAAGNKVAQDLGAKTSGQAERQNDLKIQEDIQGEPTPIQQQAAGNLVAGIDARTMMIGGALLLTVVVVVVVGGRK